MFLIADLLERAKARGNIESDYRLGKVIGITHQAISGYRAGLSLPKDKVIAQLCALSGDDPHMMLAQIQAERASSPEAKKLWDTLVKRLAGGASTAIFSVLFAITLIAGGAGEARAAALNHVQTVKVNLLYIVSSTFLSVAGFVERRHRWIPAFCWLCRLTVS